MLPQVRSLDALWNKKQRERTQAQPPQERKFEPIEVPKNSATGFIIAFFAVVAGFAYYCIVDGGCGGDWSFSTMLAFAFRDEEESRSRPIRLRAS